MAGGDGRGTDDAHELLVMARMAYASIGLGTALAIWLPDANSFSSPVAQFVVGALPWVLVAIGLACFFASHNR